MPIINNKIVSIEDYSSLPIKTKKNIEKKRSHLDPFIIKTTRQIRSSEDKGQEKIEKNQENILKKIIEKNYKKIRNKFEKNKTVTDFIDLLHLDLVKNIQHLIKNNLHEYQAQENTKETKQRQKRIIARYHARLLVDNSILEKKFLFEENPTMESLFGQIKKKMINNQLETNHLMIEPGSIHKANNNFLVINCNNFLQSEKLWSYLKKAIKEKKITIPQTHEDKLSLTKSLLTPEPIPLNINVVLVGSEEIYSILYDYDEDLDKIFKIKTKLDEYLNYTQINTRTYLMMIDRITKDEQFRPFSRSSLTALFDYSSRLMEHRKKLSTDIHNLRALMVEANLYAKQNHSKYVTKLHVEKARFEKLERINQVERELLELVKDKSLSINTTGKAIGQCNALCIYDMGNYSFGRINKVSCVTLKSDDGIINIERSSKLSGKIHTKASQITSSFLLAIFSKNNIPPISASVCFEQSYDEIDGDSASAAELLVIVSTMSQIPIKQNYAITGSLNQHGAIQAVGGINEKIEGCYKTFKALSKTEQCSIIIPDNNKDNLVLNEETKKAVAQKKLIIYPVKSFSQVFELATDTPFGINTVNTTRLIKNSALHKIKILSKKEQEKEDNSNK